MAEIRRAPVEVGSLSHHLRRVLAHPNGVCLRFLNHQQLCLKVTPFLLKRINELTGGEFRAEDRV